MFGKAEPLRMCLHKAGVVWEDVRVTGDSWLELKASGKLEFNQVPMLELPNGERLV